MSDAWGVEESQLNKIGTYILVGCALVAALLLWGVVPIHVPVAVLFIVVSIGGLVGGALNVAGRGPLWAGSLVGLVMALGGFGAVHLWIRGRQSVRGFEIAIAFVIGGAPGFLLQHFMPRMLGKTPE